MGAGDTQRRPPESSHHTLTFQLQFPLRASLRPQNSKTIVLTQHRERMKFRMWNKVTYL